MDKISKQNKVKIAQDRKNLKTPEVEGKKENYQASDYNDEKDFKTQQSRENIDLVYQKIKSQ